MKNVGGTGIVGLGLWMVGLVAVAASTQAADQAISPIETTVGVSAELSDLILPGSELEPVPVVTDRYR